MNLRLQADHFYSRGKKPLAHYTTPFVGYARYAVPTYLRRPDLVDKARQRHRVEPALSALLMRQAG